MTSGNPPVLQPHKPLLDTSYRPAPHPAGEQTTTILRPLLTEMLLANTPMERRVEILDQIPPDLTTDEATALIRELCSIPPKEENPAAHSTYIHKICCLLQKTSATRDDFASALATIAANRELPVVYRDYAFQHLRNLWRASRDEANSAGRQRMDAIQNTFRALMQQRPETTAQSLLGLHEIREKPGTPVIMDEEISRLATSILNSSPTPDSIPSRMTAVRVLAERRIPESNATLRDIATSTVEHSLVRASAIAALGFIGQPSDLEFLQKLPTGDPVIAGALRHVPKND
jgi:hypothetical protein